MGLGDNFVTCSTCFSDCEVNHSALSCVMGAARAVSDDEISPKLGARILDNARH
jgi:hypothetical protein